MWTGVLFLCFEFFFCKNNGSSSILCSPGARDGCVSHVVRHALLCDLQVHDVDVQVPEPVAPVHQAECCSHEPDENPPFGVLGLPPANAGVPLPFPTCCDCVLAFLGNFIFLCGGAVAVLADAQH